MRGPNLYVHKDAEALFEQLKEKYGSHSAAAEAIDVPRETYRDWRKRGLSTERKWKRIIIILRGALGPPCSKKVA